MKRRFAISVIVMSLTVAMALSGCAGKEEPLPDTIGSELGLYLLGDKVVDVYGKEITNNDSIKYLLDENGNVVTEENGKMTVVVAAANMSEFTCLTEASFDETGIEQKIPLYAFDNGTEAYGKTTWTMTVTVGPENVLNDTVVFASADPRTVCFVDGESEIQEKGSGAHKLEMIAEYPGTASLFVRNCLGEVIGTVQFSIEGEKVDDEKAVKEIEEKVAACEHTYIEEVVAPTETAEGYTQHTCTKCGQVYRNNYTEKLPCSHTFAERKVNATCKDTGYTLCVCTKCGFETRKDYTELASHAYKDEVVAPTCAAEGYTLHTCTVCGHVLKDSVKEKISHKYEEKVVAPTCTEKGYTLHTCSVCGANYADNYKDQIAHNYSARTVPATYTEKGYTLHTCNVCGYGYKDNYTDKLVCTNHSFTEVSRTEATCTAAGAINSRCMICGQSKSDPIPAKGHSYTESTTQPTCFDSGCTTHTCQVCGHSYTDTMIPALGHAWAERQTQKETGKSQHTFCSVCGVDMTASGLGGAHSEAHALAGEGGGTYQKSVPVYETVTEKYCTRCGTVQ